MNYTLEPTRTTRRIVELRYPAWEGCTLCGGSGDIPIDPFGVCLKCNGEGGAWHEATKTAPWGQVMGFSTEQITKSSILILSGEACGECGGDGGIDYSYECHGQIIPEGEECTHCSGTGIEPGTEKWEVE